jgi:hypothetical protein
MLRVLRFLLTGVWRRESRCVGYHTSVHDHTSCPALRSPWCSDGRCRRHCGDECECEKLNGASRLELAAYRAEERQ